MTPSPSVAAAVAATASTPDPFWTVIISAVGGAVLTLISGYIRHRLTGRRERSKWELEARYEAYTDYLARIRPEIEGMAQDIANKIAGRPISRLTSVDKVFLRTQLLASPKLMDALHARESAYLDSIAHLAQHFSLLFNANPSAGADEIGRVVADYVESSVGQSAAGLIAEVVVEMRQELGTLPRSSFLQKSVGATKARLSTIWRDRLKDAEPPHG
ncbi:hypothetical protein [Sinomonas sp. P10A9]|uniref:Uncharacterized protein n=1 Tax=Sinomonas puerhi TaxID=3238584 RepID=A0AB39KZA3_9MICC